ncbi:MAG: PAS domain S-box protein [Gracilimonas sp.]|nr:PAS domain S-box protein [Gracilimonas sp.]
MVREDHIFSVIELDEVGSAILNALSSQIAILNANGEIVAFNKHWKRAGQEKERHWSHPDLEESILESLQTPLAEGNDFALRLLIGIKEVLNQNRGTFETKLVCHYGEEQKWYQVKLNSLGHKQGAVLIYEDISYRTREKNYLRETRQLLEKHFNNSLYGILIADEKNTVIDANNVACEMLEASHKTLLYSDIGNYLIGDFELNASDLQKQINRDGNYIGERQVITENGKKVPVEVSVTLFRHKDGSLVTSWAFKDISAKKEAEKALKFTEHQYRLQFNNTLVGTIIGRPNGEILAANPAACKMLGYTAEELEGKHRDIIFDSNHPENAKALTERRNNNMFTGELEFTHKDGHTVHTEVNSVIFEGEDGTEKTIISLNDISSRKNIQQQLLQEKEFTELAISTLPTAFFVFSVEGKMIRWNSILEDEFGYTSDEISGMNVMQLVHPEDRYKLSNILDNEFNDEKVSIEVRCITKAGETLHYLIRGTSFKQNDTYYIVGGGLNRNDFKEAEVERRRNSELLNQLFYNSPIGIVLVDADGNVQNANQSFETIFGFDNNELSGKPLNSLIVPDHMDQHAENLSKMSFTGDSFQTETVRKHKNGNTFPVLVGGVPVEFEGEVIAIYGMYVDISERKKLENKIVSLLETEKKARIHLEEMFDEAPSAIAMLEGPDHKYTYANERFKTLVDKKALVGKFFEKVLPELSDQGFSEVLQSCYQSGKSFHFNERKVYFNNQKNGHPSTHYLNFVFKPLLNEEHTPYGVLIEAIDVSEQVEARNIIEKSLREKNTLLGEVHHRVKNNLAIISGLLELELMSSTNQEANKLLSSTQSRITSIAKIHELLYQSENLSHVNFKDYIRKVLSNEIKSTGFLVDSFELDDVDLNVNQAIPAGILLNEMMACLNDINNKEYNSTQGDLSMTLNNQNTHVEIVLAEKTKPMFRYYEACDAESSTLRKELIEVLLKQIHGDLTVDMELGLLSIRFAKREVKGPHNALNSGAES